MRVSIVDSPDTHQIRLFEFVDVNGRLITSFFQAVITPDRSIGVFDTIYDARDAAEECVRYNFVPLLQ